MVVKVLLSGQLPYRPDSLSPLEKRRRKKPSAEKKIKFPRMGRRKAMDTWIIIDSAVSSIYARLPFEC